VIWNARCNDFIILLVKELLPPHNEHFIIIRVPLAVKTGGTPSVTHWRGIPEKANTQYPRHEHVVTVKTFY
jgi:hypothetical protein